MSKRLNTCRYVCLLPIQYENLPKFSIIKNILKIKTTIQNTHIVYIAIYYVLLFIKPLYLGIVFWKLNRCIFCIRLSLAMCDPGCENNGTCMSPEVCICPDGFSGKRCERGKLWFKTICSTITRIGRYNSTG